MHILIFQRIQGIRPTHYELYILTIYLLTYLLTYLFRAMLLMLLMMLELLGFPVMSVSILHIVIN